MNISPLSEGAGAKLTNCSMRPPLVFLLVNLLLLALLSAAKLVL